MSIIKTPSEPWELIYQKEGRVFHEPFPAFPNLVKEFRNYHCERILDLGCGSGMHVVHLAKAGFRLSGLDNSPTGLCLARDWLQEEGLPARLVLADMRLPLPFRPETFDGLLSTQVIHHAKLATVLGTIAEIWRVLTWGGIAFVTVPAQHDPDGSFEEIKCSKN